MTWATERISFKVRPRASLALETPEVKSALPRYRKILLDKAKTKFQLAKKSGQLDKKLKAAHKILSSCELCERKCSIDRTKGELGWCQTLDKMITSSVFSHFGEEIFLCPSFTIFFWSCTFSCRYCQNWTISQRVEPGQVIKPKVLAKEIDAHAASCRNANFVGGSPTPYLPFILETLKHMKSSTPIIWNSNFYMSKKAMDLLNGVIDVYLSDFKYGNDKCAKRLSLVKNYWAVVRRNHDLAFKDSEMVIRHLVLPNHFACCTKPILEYIAEHYGKKVICNIMGQYRPMWKAHKYPDIARTPTKKELEQAWELAEDLDLNWIK